MTDLVTVGWLTIDDIVLCDRTYEQNVLGGGALYSAVGAQIWNDRVGIHSVAGRSYIDQVRQGIEQRGLDATGVNAIDGGGLRLWLLHESETDKQQVPKLSSSTSAQMDAGRDPLPPAYRRARGFHIAPQTPAGSLANLETLSKLASNPVITLDILADAYIDAGLYRNLAFLKKVTAFLPSKTEIERIWRPTDMEDWLRRQASTYGCHIGVKLGQNGSLVCEAAGDRIYSAPAFPAQALDTTGAGDAYCGGFLAGLVEGRPIGECAAMGTVSASFVIEARGALATARPTPEDRDARLALVLAGIEAHAPARRNRPSSI